MIKCFNDELFPPKRRWYTSQGHNENVGKIFVENLERDIEKIYKEFKFKKNMRINRKEKGDFRKALVCHICEGGLDGDKVRGHCHLTGKYRGAAHDECNLNYRVPKFYPVIFHNLSGYDTHMFIKDLAETEGEINCIAKTEENYISFSKRIVVDIFEKEGKKISVKRDITFIDSFRFMPSSLAELASNLTDYKNLKMFFEGRKLELLKRKGVYPYDYMNSLEKLSETSLPHIEHFYSKLNDTNISISDYQHAQKVWKEFNMKSMRDYHDLYLKTDVLLLTDVFEEFRKVCLDNYKLDPAWYYTSPGLAWDAALRMTGVKLELLHDQEMLHMVEEGIRGGVSMISTRYGKANNKYMQEYDPSLPTKYIIYLDANNLYGWAMSRKLPTDGFKWMSKDGLAHWENKPCILEVDLEYQQGLHDLHNDYPLAPEQLEVNGVRKLIPNLSDKKKNVVHYEALKLYENYGLKITKIHRGITFEESAWLKDYIDLNTRLRRNSKNDFESNFFKLMNNSVFGKTMERRTGIKLATTEEQVEKWIYRPNYKHRTTFSDSLVAIHMAKTKLYFNKPVYLGMCILDLSKTLMYEFHYEYIKSKYGDKAKLLFTDTDSLMYEIETEDFYKDIGGEVRAKFDTSNYSSKPPSGIETGVNKKVIGMFKDEAGGEIIAKFVGFRAKNYSYVYDYLIGLRSFLFLFGKDDSEQKKCKGIMKCVTKNNISFEDYKDCLFSNIPQPRNVVQLRKMNVFKSRGHTVYTEEVNKIALSANDDKRIILEDGIHTLAHGHFKRRLGGGSVLYGTTCNSSLTNPLLGAPSDR